VNGGIRLGEGARARSVDTVNGGITLGSKAIVGGDVETVNGGIHMAPESAAEGDVGNINGAIELERAHVRGGISTVNGDVTIGDGSRVEGGILVEEPNCGWFGCWGSRRPPRVVIGAGAVVGGTLKFEQEVKLYVHESAQIGPVEGATAERYSGSAPPRD
jgi:acetyltransferase-like isoleucine patch superfamily enzyme